MTAKETDRLQDGLMEEMNAQATTTVARPAAGSAGDLEARVNAVREARATRHAVRDAGRDAWERSLHVGVIQQMFRNRFNADLDTEVQRVQVWGRTAYDVAFGPYLFRCWPDSYRVTLLLARDCGHVWASENLLSVDGLAAAVETGEEERTELCDRCAYAYDFIGRQEEQR